MNPFKVVRLAVLIPVAIVVLILLAFGYRHRVKIKKTVVAAKDAAGEWLRNGPKEVLVV